MNKNSYQALQIIAVVVIWLIASFDSSQANAQDSVGLALNKCAGIGDDENRLACYDALATVLADDQDSVGDAGTVAATTAATAAVAADVGSVPLTDEIGKERVEPKSDDEQPRFAANVTSCQKSAQSGQFYFIFENGQVWKQSNYRSLNLRDCVFDVEISKSGFGYQMYIPSKDRTVRVARVK